MIRKKFLFRKPLSRSLLAVASVAMSGANAEIDVNSLSLEELLKVKVITASKREQSIDESPAFVEIITQSDLKRRAYKDLSYLLDDISGIQVIRAQSDNYVNTIWRGVRHTIGSSHLILVDGLRFNHLYTNEAEVLAAIPLSNIKHVEIVYGPGSVAYGNDAVVGIINVITLSGAKQLDEDTKFTGFAQVGDNNLKVLDTTYARWINDWHLSFTARIDKGDIDTTHFKEYTWTDPALLRDPNIWGGFADRYGSADSPHDNRGLDLRLRNENSELALQYYQLANGYGSKYTFDHSMPDAGLWYETDFSVSWKWQKKLSEKTDIRTLVRYRDSDFDNDSFFIEGYHVTDPVSNQAVRLVDASYWESENYSYTTDIELNWEINQSWHLTAGLGYESKRLQKAYNVNFGPSLPPEQISLATYPLPSPPSQDSVENNHIDTNQSSVFALAEYSLSGKKSDFDQKLHFGIRTDHHSEYDSESSLRAGYVGRWQKTTFKLFYGEAFQEPSARLLYGGWQGAGSDPNLTPRDAQTWDFNINYQLENWLLSANLYSMESENLFNTTDNGAVNAGKATAEGGDIRVRFQTENEWFDKISAWAAFSWIEAEEQSFDSQQQLVWHPTGDIADSTFHFGSYLTINDRWQVNLRGRHYGKRVPIKSNPLDSISSFTSLDLNVVFKPLDSAVSYQLALNNLFDEIYFHPGLRSASARNDTNGGLDDNGVWFGSESFYNAQIPQAGREITVSVYWNF